MNSNMTEIIERILGFEKKFTNYIIDPLHGQIGLTLLENNIIRTKVFSRLKNIQQLGFASNIYPGATHKRYDHCIGTLHVTWTMLKQFLMNYSDQKQWASKELLKYFSDDILECLRLAALFHDIGHGPFSHTFEQIAGSLGQKIDHDKITTYLLTYDFEEAAIDSLFPDKRMLSEIKQSNEMTFFREELKAVPKEYREIIVGIYEKEFDRLLTKPEGFDCIRLFLNSILKGDVGSDRVDYLLRDTYFSGLGHRFNFSDLLSNLRGMYDTMSNRLLFAVDYNGKNIVDFIMMTRYYHYKLIAHHPRNILEETKFKERIREKTKQDNFSFYSAATDNDGIERELPIFEKDIELSGNWSMGSIGIDHFRFFFYRIAGDPKLRNEYSVRIKENIIDGVKKHSNLNLNKEDIFLEFTIETPHLPIMQIHRPEYRIEKDGDVEKYSVLLHDYSILVQGLARTYLEDSSLLLFVRKEDREKVSKFTRSTIHFYVNTQLFEALMSSVKSFDENRYDFLLVALHNLTGGGYRSFSGAHNLFERIQEFQIKNKVDFYDFDNKLFYDPDYGSFCYPKVIGKEQSLLDDLFLFDAAGLIEIRKHLVTKDLGKKPFRSYSYFFTPTRRHKEIGLKNPMIPIKSCLKLYSEAFRRNYDLTPDKLRAF